MTEYDWIWLNMTMNEYYWIWLNMTEYDWIWRWLTMTDYDWIWLNMIQYVWIWLNMTKNDQIGMNMNEYGWVWLNMTMAEYDLHKINGKCSHEISARYKSHNLFSFYTFLLLFQMQAGWHPRSYAWYCTALAEPDEMSAWYCTTLAQQIFYHITMCTIIPLLSLSLSTLYSTFLYSTLPHRQFISSTHVAWPKMKILTWNFHDMIVGPFQIILGVSPHLV